MDYQDISFDIREAVAVITLDRPEQLNAFTGTMGEELGHAYRRCDRDDAIRVVVVTKRLLWDSANLTRVEVGDRETALHHHLMSRSDAREGVLAYLERRPPRWAQSVNDDWPD